jgi:hypothetical protein
MHAPSSESRSDLSTCNVSIKDLFDVAGEHPFKIADRFGYRGLLPAQLRRRLDA